MPHNLVSTLRSRVPTPEGAPVPTYQYACKQCGHQFEVVQSFSDDSLTECPECQGVLRKLYGAVGVIFQASGFYRTDSRSWSNGSSSSSTTSASSSGSSGSDSSSGTSSSSDSSSSSSSASTPSSNSSSSSSSSSASASTPAAS